MLAAWQSSAAFRLAYFVSEEINIKTAGVNGFRKRPCRIIRISETYHNAKLGHTYEVKTIV